jgi:hypothetical protein
MDARRNITNQPTFANSHASVAQKYFPPFVAISSRPHVIKKQIAAKGSAPETLPAGLLKIQY